MKTPAAAPSSNGTLTTRTIASDALIANPWNPNRMTSDMYSKAIESITLYGFIDPLTVREKGSLYEIIDGEHRFKAGVALGMLYFPVIDLGPIDDATAKKLTLVLNELRGQVDPDKMGPLLQSIIDDTSLEDMLKAMPFEVGTVAGYLQMPDLASVTSKMPKPKAEPKEEKEPWAERTYRMPKTVALVVDEAIEKAKDGEEIEVWQALERVAADYLAG